MELWCLLLLLITIITLEAEAQLLFQHKEGDACITRSGTIGTCQRSCGSSSTSGARDRCGIKDSTFLVCCDRDPDKKTQPLTDIAPPTVAFQCGKNTRNSFFLSIYGTEVGALRPATVPPPPREPGVEETTPIRPNLPGFPPGRLEEGTKEFLENLPPGVGGAIGGVSAEKNAWPWMALVGERTAAGIRWFCGGVLISEEWVLTALHCFFDNSADVVRLGEHNYNDDYDRAAHEDFGVAETVLYPGHRHPEAYHDLALLRLASKVALKEFISPVCLPWGAESDTNITGQKATLTGWGDTEFGGFPSSILQEVNVTVFPAAQCDRSYSSLPHYPTTWPRGIGQETLCAGDPAGGRDACQGDSGGPLVFQNSRRLYVLAGIVSRGYGCGHKDYPGLYVNLLQSPYLVWIKKVAFSTQ